MILPPNVAQWLDAFYKKLDAIHNELKSINSKMDIPEDEEEKELRLKKDDKLRLL